MMKIIAASATLIISVLILLKILKSDNDLWQALFLLHMLYGFAFEKEPKRLAMNIYEVCTKVSVIFETEKEMHSFQDLVDSGVRVKIFV